MKFAARLLALFLVFAVPAWAGEDEHHIIHLMKSQFDTPENPLLVEPVIVRGDHAVAGWAQGEKGGRALLSRHDGQWQIRLCSGDALKDPAMLTQAGISEADAQAMTAYLVAAEGKMDPAVVAKFSLFEGTLMLDGSEGVAHQGHSHNHSTTKSE